MKSLRDFIKRAMFTSGGLPPSVAKLPVLRNSLLWTTGCGGRVGAQKKETFEKCPILFKVKTGEDSNRRNTL